MMSARIIFLLITSLLNAHESHAQKRVADFQYIAGFFQPISLPAGTIKGKVNKNDATMGLVVPVNHYSAGLGFFCRKEIQFDRKTIIPLRFRLGSVEACKRMEGYPNFR
jgi:hypothetical protein